MQENVSSKEDKLNLLKEYLHQFKNLHRAESNLITILHKVQDIYGYLDRKAIEEVANSLKIPTSHIWGVATFYHHFKLRKPGKHIISVCLGTACYIKGANEIFTILKEELKIDKTGISEDGFFSLEEARCLGACSLAPVIMIDGKIYGNLTAKNVLQIIKEYRKKENKEH
jgi:NADH:ubiquinone oxidoreductase subunit E